MLEKLIKDKKIQWHHVPESHQSFTQLYPSKSSAPFEVAVSFVYTLEDMSIAITQAEKDLQPEGMLYLCYPKLKNNLGISGIHRDHILPYLKVNPDTGYISESQMRFNRMISLDDDYTLLGVKYDTKMKSRPAVSMKVEDYEHHVTDIINILKNEACLNFYESLTPGYQKGWARYIFSAKTDETKQKRIEEMIVLLNQGIKSKELAKK
jgi:hypothetical protein